MKTGATHVSMLVGRTVQRNADRYDRIRQGLSSGRQMSVGNAERRQPESRCILRFNRCRQVMAGYDRIPSAGYGKNLENLIGMEGYRLIPIKCNLYSTSYAVDGEAGRGCRRHNCSNMETDGIPFEPMTNEFITSFIRSHDRTDNTRFARVARFARCNKL